MSEFVETNYDAGEAVGLSGSMDQPATMSQGFFVFYWKIELNSNCRKRRHSIWRACSRDDYARFARGGPQVSPCHRPPERRQPLVTARLGSVGTVAAVYGGRRHFARGRGWTPFYPVLHSFLGRIGRHNDQYKAAWGLDFVFSISKWSNVEWNSYDYGLWWNGEHWTLI